MSARLLNSLKERERLNTLEFIENQKHIMHECRMCIANMTMMNMLNETRRQQRDVLKTHLQNIQIWVDSEKKLIQFLQRQREYFQHQLEELFTSALEAHISYSQSLNTQLQKLQEEYNNL